MRVRRAVGGRGGEAGRADVRLEEERHARERPQVGGLVVGRDLPLPLVAAVLEPDLDLRKERVAQLKGIACTLRDAACKDEGVWSIQFKFCVLWMSVCALT